MGSAHISFVWRSIRCGGYFRCYPSPPTEKPWRSDCRGAHDSCSCARQLITTFANLPKNFGIGSLARVGGAFRFGNDPSMKYRFAIPVIALAAILALARAPAQSEEQLPIDELFP